MRNNSPAKPKLTQQADRVQEKVVSEGAEKKAAVGENCMPVLGIQSSNTALQ